MAMDWRKGALWLIAVLFAAVLAGWAVISWRGDAAVQGARSMGGPPAPAADAPAKPASAAAAVAEAAPACRESPLLARKGDDDGQERLQAKAASASADEVAALIRTGKEAAASGRQRDAEVSFLNACRNAALLQGDDAIALPDAMYQLARLYANAAALGAKKPQELFERAERLYEASLAAYTGRYGPAHEKTKFAQQGLETVRVATGHTAQAATAKAAPAPGPAPAAAAPVVEAAAAAPVAEPDGEAKAPAPEKAAEAKQPAARPAAVKAETASAPAEKTETASALSQKKEAAKPPAPKRPATTAPSEEQQAEAAPPSRKRVRQPRPEVVETGEESTPAPARVAEPAPEPVEPQPRREVRRAVPAPEPMAIEQPAAEPPPPRATSMGAPAMEPARPAASMGTSASSDAPASEAPVVVVPETQ